MKYNILKFKLRVIHHHHYYYHYCLYHHHHVSNGQVQSGCTDPTEATACLVIYFLKAWKGTFWSDRTEMTNLSTRGFFSRATRSFRRVSATGQHVKTLWNPGYQMTGSVNIDHLQRGSQKFRSERTEMVRSI